MYSLPVFAPAVRHSRPFGVSPRRGLRASSERWQHLEPGSSSPPWTYFASPYRYSPNFILKEHVFVSRRRMAPRPSAVISSLLAEFELPVIQERVRAGVARARAQEKKLGRPRLDAKIERRKPRGSCRGRPRHPEDRRRSRGLQRHGAAPEDRAGFECGLAVCGGRRRSMTPSGCPAMAPR